MRKVYFSMFIVLMFAVISARTSLAKTIVQIDELILMIPDAEAGRNDKAITIALSSLQGVEVVDYCNSQKCFYLRVDRALQPNNDNIFTTIRTLGYAMDIKLEGTIQQAQANCTDITE